MTEPKIEILTDVVVTAICHRCGAKFDAHPLWIDDEPIALPSWVCKKCKAKDKEDAAYSIFDAFRGR